MRPTSAFAAGWLLLAAPVAATRLGLWGQVHGDASVAMSVALVLLGVALVLHGVERFVLPRFMDAEDVHLWKRAIAAIFVLSLLAQWTAFWVLDMRHARFQVVLLAIPIAVLALPIFRIVAARRRDAVLGWACIAAFSAVAPFVAWKVWFWMGGPGAYYEITRPWFQPSEAALASSLVAGIVAGRGLPRNPIQREERARPAAEPDRWFAFVDVVSRAAGAGVLHGMALVWPLLVLRGEMGGCSGISGAFELTELVTLLTLYSVGPIAAGALLEAPPRR